MREIVSIPVDVTVPARNALLEAMGVSENAEPSPKVNELLDEALNVYTEYSEPRGLYRAVTKEDFGRIHKGIGKNEPETPLDTIYTQSDKLALFAVTLGEAISKRITSLFDSNDGAAGYTLDAAASEAAEKAADYLQQRYRNSLTDLGGITSAAAILRYSPGYCGWDISGQGKAFEYLEPGEIGIALNNSYLMQPLKSVSGVFVVGEVEIHRFRPDYPFCERCLTRSCLERMRSIIK